jgi:hypothetical protein
MSYLTSPRLSFAGRFVADVSTINNVDADTTNNAWDPGWNSVGTGAFDFLGCKVTGAWTPLGPAADDPVSRYAISGRPDGASAKMVDLDPSCQFASQLWALWVRLWDPVNGELAFVGRYEVASFRDLWRRQRRELDAGALINGQPSGARFVSTLTDVQWGPAADRSPFLEQLRTATANGRLAIGLHQLGYFYNTQHARHRTGTLIGSIGPAMPGEPLTVLAGRRLNDATGGPVQKPFTAISFIDLEVTSDEKRLAFDLGHALLIDNPDGDITDLGKLPSLSKLKGCKALVLALKPATFKAWVRSTQSPRILAEINPFGAGWYRQTGGIVDVELSTPQAGAVRAAPLALFARMADGSLMGLCAETRGGIFVRSDSFVRRMDPGANDTVVFHARRYGRPAAGVPLYLQAPMAMPFPPGPDGVVNDPHPALAATDQLVTGADGQATLSLAASDPGSARRHVLGKTWPVDGQVYMISFSPSGAAGAPDLDGGDTGLTGLDAVFVHVREKVEVPSQPDWTQHVQPIMVDYAQLYPVMSKHLFDIADRTAFVRHRAQLLLAFSRTMDDSNYMPVTRDMSDAKRQIIVNWLNSAAGESESAVATQGAQSGAKPLQPKPPPKPKKVAPKKAVPEHFDAKRDGPELYRNIPKSGPKGEGQ